MIIYWSIKIYTKSVSLSALDSSRMYGRRASEDMPSELSAVKHGLKELKDERLQSESSRAVLLGFCLEIAYETIFQKNLRLRRAESSS